MDIILDCPNYNCSPERSFAVLKKLKLPSKIAVAFSAASPEAINSGRNMTKFLKERVPSTSTPLQDLTRRSIFTLSLQTNLNFGLNLKQKDSQTQFCTNFTKKKM